MLDNTYKSYGAWISKDEIIPVLDKYCHDESAIKILCEKFNRKITKGLKFYSLHKIMYRLGYVRLVYFGEVYNVEYWKSAKLSKFQKEIIAESDNKEYAAIWIYPHESIVQ